MKFTSKQQHEEDEKIQVCEEAEKAFVMAHVTGRVYMDQKSDSGDNQ